MRSRVDIFQNRKDVCCQLYAVRVQASDYPEQSKPTQKAREVRSRARSNLQVHYTVLDAPLYCLIAFLNNHWGPREVLDDGEDVVADLGTYHGAGVAAVCLEMLLRDVEMTAKKGL